MKLIKINKKNLNEFIKKLRYEDRLELINTFGNNYERKFLNLILKINKDIYFLSDNYGTPLVLGGVYKINNENSTIGQVWFMSTYLFFKHKYKILKFIKNKLNYYIHHFDILFNYIYKSNFKSLSWIKKLGFNVKNLKNKDYKLFYINKGETDFDS